MKIAFLTTDNREQQSKYELDAPFFGTAPAALLDGFAALPEVEVHVISCAKRRMSSPALLAPNIHFHQPVVPKAGWGRSLFLGCALAVRHLLRELRPDIVHGQGTERDCAVSMMLAPCGRRVLTIHGHMARIAEITGARFPDYYWLARQLEALAVRRADGVVALTRYTRDRVGTAARRTWVLPNAVDASFFNVNSTGAGGYALCVANVHAWKRQVELIEALDAVDPALRPRLVFLGDASATGYGERFHALVAERPWCEYAGLADRTALKEWLRNAAMVILPSIEDNCPMVLLEAAAAGVPVAASRIGGIPDLIDDGITGVMFDPRDPADMAGAVKRLAADPGLRRTMAEAAKTEALKRFHPASVARGHLQLYRELLAPPQHAASRRQQA